MSSINAVQKIEDDSGEPVSYKCEYHIGTGAISDERAKEVPSYYDMLYPCGSSLEDEIAHVSTKLLTHIATKYKILPDGTACSIPDTTLSVWLLGLSSDPSDSPYDNLSCQRLQPNTSDQCCSVVYAPMTFWATGSNVQPQDLMSIMASAIDTGNVTAGFDIQIAYIGSVMNDPFAGSATDPRTNLAPSINAPADRTTASKSENSKSLTVVGGTVLAGLAVAFFGMFVVLLRKRRTSTSRSVHVEVSNIKHDGDIEDSQSDGPTLDIDVMSDDIPTTASNQRDRDRDYGTDEDYHPSSYTFDLDLANSMKNDIMGSYGFANYGPTSISVVPPYPMIEETSDSEVDSWAQTDGTVGSLEERLEEITAEI